MRISILGTRGYPAVYGGYETLTRFLVPHLVESGHDVIIYGRPGHSEDVDLPVGVEVRETSGKDGKSSSALTFGLSSSIACAKDQPDVALCLNLSNGFYLPILKARGVPTVANTDGLEWRRDKWGWAGKTAFRRAAFATAKMADTVVADARTMQLIWQEIFDRKCDFIAYGAPVIDRSTVGTDYIESLGLADREYALVVARLVPENNIDVVLDAAAELKGTRRIVIVGAKFDESPLERKLKALADDGMVDSLGYVSDQDDLYQLWAHCGVYLHGHSVGGTNPSLLQAMGVGAPVVAFDSSFNHEVLGDSADYFEDDPKFLAELIERRLDAPHAATDELGEKFKQIVAERYDWADICDQYESVLMRTARAAGRG